MLCAGCSFELQVWCYVCTAEANEAHKNEVRLDVNWLEEPEGLPCGWGAFLRSEAAAGDTAGAVLPPRTLFLLDRPIPRADSGKLVGKAELAGVQGQ